jgi:hypothetical protein
MHRRYSIALAVLFLALLPNATTAEASLVPVVTNRCNTAAQSSETLQAKINIVHNRQRDALQRVHTRLKGLVDQTKLQGHDLPQITSDENSLQTRISQLESSYEALLTSVIAMGAQCNSPASQTAVSSNLLATRSLVQDISQWSNTHITTDLQNLVKP